MTTRAPAVLIKTWCIIALLPGCLAHDCNFFIPLDLALDILNTGSPTGPSGDCNELFWVSFISKITATFLCFIFGN